MATITKTSKPVTFFSDVSLDFIANPITKDVRPVTNENAIKNSLRNLLRTPLGSRPYRPTFGVDIHRFLFEQIDPFLESDLNEAIAYAIKLHEPRVTLIAIESDINDTAIELTIEYYVKNTRKQDTLNTVLARLK